MTTIHLTVKTTVAPERIIGALTDFTQKRLELWPNIDPQYYKVHDVQASLAEVTEGSSFFGGVWERARYDWSQPGHIVITVLSSNAFAPGSFWEYLIKEGENGGSQIDFTLHRVGKSLKGRVLAFMLSIFGRRIFRRDLDQTLKRLTEVATVVGLS